MKPVAILALGAASAACATTTAQMTAKDPFKAYTSTRNHADIAQCIARTVPGAAVLPGTKETVVNVQNPDGPILLTWVITQIANGSIIKVWRANSLAPGISRAEACF